MRKRGSRGKARDRILEATIALLLETRDVDLTVRAIAGRAGVGVGLVNYHFGDKNNLVREAARLFLGRQIIKGYGERPPVAATPRGQVAALLGGPMGFLAQYPKLSRVSVLHDLVSPTAGDNSDDTFREIEGALRKHPAAGSWPPDLPLRLWTALGSIHEAFLRPERFRERTGLDFARAEDRAVFAVFLAGLVVPEPSR